MAHNSTLTPRKVFFSRTRRGKNDLILFRRRGVKNSAEGFFDSLKGAAEMLNFMTLAGTEGFFFA